MKPRRKPLTCGSCKEHGHVHFRPDDEMHLLRMNLVGKGTPTRYLWVGANQPDGSDRCIGFIGGRELRRLARAILDNEP